MQVPHHFERSEGENLEECKSGQDFWSAVPLPYLTFTLIFKIHDLEIIYKSELKDMMQLLQKKDLTQLRIKGKQVLCHRVIMGLCWIINGILTLFSFPFYFSCWFGLR